MYGLCAAHSAAETSIDIQFLDKTTGEPISGRVEFTLPAIKAPRPRGSLTAGKYLLVEGKARFTITPGAYEFYVRRGPEFSDIRGGFELEKNAKDAMDVFVPHKTPMRAWGWHCGDLQSPMPSDLLKRWMRADDLDVVASTSDATQPAIVPGLLKTKPESGSIRSTEASQSKNASTSSSNEMVSPPSLQHVQTQSLLFDKPDQGGLLVHRLAQPQIDQPSLTSFAYLDQLESKASAFIELTKPWDRDVPLLLATERIDSVQILSRHLQPESADSISPAVRNPDALRFKGKKGLGRLGEFIYWKMLDAGLRLPPTAGTGFDGKLSTHLGYNRVYVWLEPESPRSIEAWWNQLRAGRAMATNGPLIRATVNGQTAGTLFPSYRREPVSLDIELELTVRDPVEYLEVVFNGQAIYHARLEDHAKRGEFPALSVTESGWLVLRVVTEHESSYRMATTAPFYFEFDNQPRISRSAVEFFQKWLEESQASIEKNADLISGYREPLTKAQQFWTNRMAQANAE